MSKDTYGLIVRVFYIHGKSLLELSEFAIQEKTIRNHDVMLCFSELPDIVRSWLICCLFVSTFDFYIIFLSRSWSFSINSCDASEKFNCLSTAVKKKVWYLWWQQSFTHLPVRYGIRVLQQPQVGERCRGQNCFIFPLYTEIGLYLYVHFADVLCFLSLLFLSNFQAYRSRGCNLWVGVLDQISTIILIKYSCVE